MCADVLEGGAVRITVIVALVLALTGSHRVSCGAAQQAPTGAAAVRGSWVTEGTSAPYMYIFAVQDDRISGVVCTRCFDLGNLAFVSDGRVQGDGLSRNDSVPVQGSTDRHLHRQYAARSAEQLRVGASARP